MLFIFVVLGNSQALIGMPDATYLNIVKINIDSIQVEIAECNTNIGQETQSVTEGCTNIGVDAINKQDANGQKDQKQQTSQ